MSDTAFFERRWSADNERWQGEGDPEVRGGRGPGPGRDSGSQGGEAGLPPIRIPVTPKNQAMLRELRARELALWEESMPDGVFEIPIRWEEPRPDRESRLILVLLGGGALALWLQASSMAVQLVAGWDRFRGWLELILGG